MSKGPWSGDKNFCPNGHDKRIVGEYVKRHICKACNKARMNRWMLTNREAYNGRRRAASAAMPFEVRKQVKGWDSDRTRNKNLRRAYGIGIEEYDAMFAAQNGLCAACGCPETMKHKGTLKRLAVDHDHSTNEVRALLCHNCNRAVGLLSDDAQKAYALAEYLKRFEKTDDLQEVG